MDNKREQSAKYAAPPKKKKVKSKSAAKTTKGDGPLKGRPSNNPKGRPKKGESLTEALRAIATPYKYQLAMKLLKKAMIEEDFTTMKYIYDRLDGLPTQAIESDGPLATQQVLVYLPDNGRN